MLCEVNVSLPRALQRFRGGGEGIIWEAIGVICKVGVPEGTDLGPWCMMVNQATNWIAY